MNPETPELRRVAYDASYVRTNQIRNRLGKHTICIFFAWSSAKAILSFVLSRPAFQEECRSFSSLSHAWSPSSLNRAKLEPQMGRVLLGNLLHRVLAGHLEVREAGKTEIAHGTLLPCLRGQGSRGTSGDRGQTKSEPQGTTSCGTTRILLIEVIGFKR